MKYYAIYKKDEFVAITDNKKYLNHYIANRKGKFNIIKINENELPEDIKNNIYLDDYMLSHYQGYYTDVDLVLTYREYTAVEDFMNDDAALLQFILTKLVKQLKYIKFTNEEHRLITYAFSYIIDFISGITESNEVLYDEYFDVKKFFYERFLKYYKKDDKSPYNS